MPQTIDPMKVAVVGGAGFMGRHAVGVLIADGHDVVVADRRVPEAGSSATYVETDARDPAAVRDVVGSVDLVLNFAGPFYEMGTVVAEVAIENGTPYVDVCDDFDATADLLALDPLAQEAGSTAITGAGMSPGLLNALAVWTAGHLDVVDELVLAWAVGERGKGGVAPVEHYLHCIHGQVPAWRDGRSVTVAAFDPAGADRFALPSPVGEIEVRDLGHPEAITVPRALDVRNVRVKGTLLPDRSNAMFETLRHLDLTSSVPLAVAGAEISPRRFVATHLTERQNARAAGSDKDRCGLAVRATGQRGGAPATVQAAWAEYITMATATAVPAVAAGLLLAAGGLRPGVHGPEVLDPAELFALASRLDPDHFLSLTWTDWDGETHTTRLADLASVVS